MADSPNNNKLNLADLVLTVGADISALNDALDQIPAAASVAAAQIQAVFDTIPATLKVPISPALCPSLRESAAPIPSDDVMRPILPASLPDPLLDLRKRARWAKTEYLLNSGNWLIVLVDRDGTIRQKKYAHEPTTADKIQAKKCLKNAVAAAREAFTVQPMPQKRDVKKACATKQRNAKRAKVRSEWLDERHPGWSLVDWRDHTGAAYETLRNYRDGITTTQTRSVRAKLAKAEGVEFSIVPK